MRILIISNEYPHPDRPHNPIIQRIVAATAADERVESVEFVPFTNRFSDFGKIRSAAKRSDLIHIHFGGAYAFLVWIALIGIRKPKFITFHGTDIHMGELQTERRPLFRLKIRINQKCSFLSLRCFDRCGFVNKSLIDFIPPGLKAKTSGKYFIQHLGVDYELFRIIPKKEAGEMLGIVSDKKQVLFSDLSGTPLKRRDIAQSIVSALGPDFELLVMNRVKPELVPVYLNACDFLLLTSDAEGSPNIVREALSLNVPVFSVDVGDVAEQIAGLRNSAIISREPEEAAGTILEKLSHPVAEDTRALLRDRLDFRLLAKDVVDIYVNYSQKI